MGKKKKEEMAARAKFLMAARTIKIPEKKASEFSI